MWTSASVPLSEMISMVSSAGPALVQSTMNSPVSPTLARSKPGPEQRTWEERWLCQLQNYFSFPVLHYFHTHYGCVTEPVRMSVTGTDLGGVCGRVCCGSEGRSRNRNSIISQFNLVWPRLPGDELNLTGLWAQPGLNLEQEVWTGFL